MSALNRTLFRRHDPFWDLEGVAARRRRKFKVVLDVSILATALAMLAVVFGSQPVPGF